MNERVSEVVSHIASLSHVASADLSNWPAHTRPGMEIRKNRAQNEVVLLKKEYSAYLGGALCLLFVGGEPEHVQTFAELAEDEGDTITVDAGKLYRDVAEKIMPTLGPSRLIESTQGVILGTQIQKIADELKVDDYRRPNLDVIVSTRVTDVSECAEKVKKAVRASVKDSLNALYLKTQIVSEALKSGKTTDLVPVVVINASTDEEEGLGAIANGRTFHVDVTEATANKDTVFKAFKQMKKVVSTLKK